MGDKAVWWGIVPIAPMVTTALYYEVYIKMYILVYCQVINAELAENQGTIGEVAKHSGNHAGELL